ncbi:MAG: glycosyltransferase family 4 protein [Butyrivibrio sp.]|nr:glycosyltransferase family 4 protein [Butyrivibrio sp.]
MYIGSLNKGGAERVMVNLAEYFFGRGYHVTLITTYLADDEYEVPHGNWSLTEKDGFIKTEVLNPDDELKYVYLKKENDGIDRVFTALMPDERGGRLANFKRRISKLRNTFKEINSDIILSFLGKNNVMAINAARGLGIPVVVSVRSNPSREYGSKGLNLSMNMLFPKAAGVVVQTTGAKEYFKDSIQKKCRILPNSIHPDFINKEIVPFENRTKTIVSVGRLDDNKNQILLIKAFAKIADKHSDYRLVIYGDGPSKNKFMDEAKSLGLLDKNIFFMGNVSGVADKIKESEIFVLSSKQEGMPNALIEAMALGLCCISTDCPCGGPKDLINTKENGILIPMGSDDAMVESLSNALSEVIADRELSKKMSEAAVSVRQEYSPDRINLMWEEYFEELMR